MFIATLNFEPVDRQAPLGARRMYSRQWFYYLLGKMGFSTVEARHIIHAKVFRKGMGQKRIHRFAVNLIRGNYDRMKLLEGFTSEG